VDCDGKSTEVRKCGFGRLNRRLGDDGQVGDHARYLIDHGSRKCVAAPSVSQYETTDVNKLRPTVACYSSCCIWSAGWKGCFTIISLPIFRGRSLPGCVWSKMGNRPLDSPNRKRLRSVSRLRSYKKRCGAGRGIATLSRRRIFNRDRSIPRCRQSGCCRIDAPRTGRSACGLCRRP
jgi:hypothetical protein